MYTHNATQSSQFIACKDGIFIFQRQSDTHETNNNDTNESTHSSQCIWGRMYVIMSTSCICSCHPNVKRHTLWRTTEHKPDDYCICGNIMNCLCGCCRRCSCSCGVSIWYASTLQVWSSVLFICNGDLTDKWSGVTFDKTNARINEILLMRKSIRINALLNC